MHYDLLDYEQENGLRILNVLMKGTTEGIHRHLDTNEVVLSLQGVIIEHFFNDNGNVTEEVAGEAGEDIPAIQIEKYRWHSISPVTNMVVVRATKAGRFSPKTTELFQKWIKQQ